MDYGGTQEAQLGILMRQYKAELLRVCYLYLRDASLAEDAAQETFVKAYQALENYRGEGSEKAWLMRIAVNTCKDMRRSAWHKYVDRRIKPEALPTTASQPFSTQDETLTLAVMALPRKLMDAVILYYYQGMDLREVADALDIAVSTVSTRLRNARMRLADALKGDDACE